MTESSFLAQAARPFRALFESDAKEGLLLIAVALAAMAAANSALSGPYHALFHGALPWSPIAKLDTAAPVDQRRRDGGVLLRRRAGSETRADRRRSVGPADPAPAGDGRLCRNGATGGGLYPGGWRGSAARARLGDPGSDRYRLRDGRNRPARQARAAGGAAVPADRGNRRRHRRGADHSLFLHRQDQADLAVRVDRRGGRIGAAQLAARRQAALVS